MGKRVLYLLVVLVLSVVNGYAEGESVLIFGSGSSINDISSYLESKSYTVTNKGNNLPDAGDLTGIDIVISVRGTGNDALKDFVANGGLLITELIGQVWVFNTAKLLDGESKTDYTGIETNSTITFTPEGLNMRLGNNIGSSYADDERSEFRIGFNHIGNGVTVLATWPDDEPAVLYGEYGEGHIVIGDMDWQDGFPAAGGVPSATLLLNMISLSSPPAPPIPHHTLTFKVDEGIRINPDRGTYMIEEGHDYTFYMYPKEGVAYQQPYVTLDGEAVVIRQTQDKLGWVYRIPAVYEDREIVVTLQEPVSNINPEEAVNIYSSVGRLTIEVAQPTSVIIYTIAGQAVVQQQINSRTDIDLPKGVYIVRTTKQAITTVVR